MHKINSVIGITLLGTMLTSGIFASNDTEEIEKIKVTRTSSPSIWKRLFVFGLLGSSGLVDKVETQSVSIVSPYVDTNMSRYINMTYPNTMPPGGRIIKQYIYNSDPSSSPYGTSNSTGWDYNSQLTDTVCLFYQNKMRRSIEIRKATNQMYQDVQAKDLTMVDEYNLLLSAMRVELESHKIEMDAAAAIGKNTACALVGEVEYVTNNTPK